MPSGLSEYFHSLRDPGFRKRVANLFLVLGNGFRDRSTAGTRSGIAADTHLKLSRTSSLPLGNGPHAFHSSQHAARHGGRFHKTRKPRCQTPQTHGNLSSPFEIGPGRAAV
ncbi:MAG: hypothetical protein OXD45_13425 [Rhodobacteraceae bacterium]|nr:hypothetical protein [Paracoccaceae bacterium]MCY4186297.1 hypothetical protein [Paracoccaceae bacterium]